MKVDVALEPGPKGLHGHDDSGSSSLSFLAAIAMVDSDIAEQLRREMKRSGKPFKTVVNEVLRRGFGHIAEPLLPFQVEPHDFQLLPGIDPDRMNQLLDELDAVEATRTLS
jgi:hypothetical protein